MADAARTPRPQIPTHQLPCRTAGKHQGQCQPDLGNAGSLGLLDLGFILLPVIGVGLNGISSVLYGTVPELVIHRWMHPLAIMRCRAPDHSEKRGDILPRGISASLNVRPGIEPPSGEHDHGPAREYAMSPRLAASPLRASQNKPCACQRRSSI